MFVICAAAVVPPKRRRVEEMVAQLVFLVKCRQGAQIRSEAQEMAAA